jgi:hypothetical protein
LGSHVFLPFLGCALSLQQVSGHQVVGNDNGSLHRLSFLLLADSFKMKYLPLQFEGE